MIKNALVNNWYVFDSKLKTIIDHINESDKPSNEQAQDIFELVAGEYNLPLFPDSFSHADRLQLEKEGIHHPSSVFEEIGIIKYLNPNEEITEIVLLALYNIYHLEYADRDLCAMMHFQNRKQGIPGEYIIFYTGDGADSILHFLNSGEDWTKPGMKYVTKIIKGYISDYDF